MTEQPAPPQYSADGRWWWTGNEWVPVRLPQPARSGTSTTKIVLALVIFSLMVIVAWAIVSEVSASNQRESDYNRMACDEYGFCDG